MWKGSSHEEVRARILLQRTSLYTVYFHRAAVSKLLILCSRREGLVISGADVAFFFFLLRPPSNTTNNESCILMPQIHFFFYFSMLKFLTPATWQTSASLFTAETFSWNTENPQTKETKDFFCRSPFFVLLTLHSVPVHNFLNPPSFMYFLIIFFFCYSVTDFQELPAKLQGRQASEISPSILIGTTCAALPWIFAQ